MLATRQARIAHGSEEDGVAAITQLGKGRLGQGLPGGQTVVGAVGKREALQTTSA